MLPLHHPEMFVLFKNLFLTHHATQIKTIPDPGQSTTAAATKYAALSAFITQKIFVPGLS
jgi:hypothetical protein